MCSKQNMDALREKILNNLYEELLKEGLITAEEKMKLVVKNK